MEKKHRDLIKKNLTALIDKTSVDSGLETKLVEMDIFTPSMLETITTTTDSTCRSRKLYMDVQRRGPRAFHGLVSALAESGNGAAARILDPSVEVGEVQGKVWNPPNYQEKQQVPYTPPPVLNNSTTPLNVRVKVASSSHQEPQAPNCYRMQASPRGLVLIIDNENFHNDIMPTRTGSVVDANNLDILFSQLGFRVTLRRNLPYFDMITEVQKFAAKPDHLAGDMAVVIILSHGRHGLVAAADGREVEVEWVLRQFNNDGCPALKGKPKLFIFQACRGDEADYGVMPAIEFPEGRTSSDARKIEPVQVKEQQEGFKELSWEDMVVAYATLPGYVANRDRYRGTWFVESLCSVMMEMAVDTDLRDMLDVVAERLSNYESEMGTKQTFAYEVRHFYKKLYFNPE